MTEDEMQAAIGRLGTTNAHRSNLSDLLAAGRWRMGPYDLTSNAYNGGISLHWDAYEIAIFQDRYETYQFADGDTQIHHWAHLPGQPLDADMLKEISQATRTEVT